MNGAEEHPQRRVHAAVHAVLERCVTLIAVERGPQKTDLGTVSDTALRLRFWRR